MNPDLRKTPPTPVAPRTLADFPLVVRSLDPERNPACDPSVVPRGSKLRLWWRCPEGLDHVWQETVNNRTHGSGCPFCRGMRPSSTNNLTKTVPKIAKQWHPTRNGTLTPRDVTFGTTRVVWWRVAAPELAASWHPTKNGKLSPRDVTRYTKTLVWWQCPNGPDHEWRTSPQQRWYVKTGCPCCANRKLSVTNCLATLRPDLAREWHPTLNGSLTPQTLVAFSHKRVWWKCRAAGHSWSTAVRDRAKPDGRGCPACLRSVPRRRVMRKVIRERVRLPGDRA